MNCPKEGCNGKLEASSRIWLDVVRADLMPDDEIVLHDVQFSRVNDHLDGQPCNFEAEFELSCSEGCTFVERWGDDLRFRMGPQPIGNKPRTLVFRNGAGEFQPPHPDAGGDAA